MAKLDLQPVELDLQPIEPTLDLQPIEEPLDLQPAKLTFPQRIKKQLPFKSLRKAVGAPELERGERTLLGNIFQRPAAAARAGIRGLAPGGETPVEAFRRGALVPEEVETFQSEFLRKFTPGTSSTIINFIGGLPASTLGLAADIATSPADLLLILTGQKIVAPIAKIPVGKTRLGILAREPIQGIPSLIRGRVPRARALVPITQSPRQLAREIPKIKIAPTVREAVTGKPIPRLRIKTQREIAQEAAEIVIRNPQSKIAQDTSQKLFRRIAEELGAGDIKPQDLPQILKDYKMNSAEFANLYVDMISTSGKELNILSQLARQVKKALPDTPEVRSVLSKLKIREPTGFETVKEIYRSVDNTRRALMVSQMATAMRNAISQAGRYTLNIFDDALTGLSESITRTKLPKDAFAPLLQDLASFGRRLKPTSIRKLNSLLDVYPITKAKLISAPIHDITVGNKVSNFVMGLNRAQEFFFRKMAFDARLTSNAQRAGVPLERVSKGMLDDAVSSALEITFAKAPGKGTAGNALLDMYSKFPFLTTVHPFPRFWTNALKFLWDFNPTGFLTAASRAKMFSKDPRAVYTALSKATLGSLMLGAANEVRKNPKIGGEKWFEIKAGKRTIDTRAFAPFSTYLFLAEMMQNPERLSGTDFAQGIVSINRIAGTGLVLVDVLRSDSFQNTARLLKEFAGSWFGGFSVPFRTISDMLGQFIPEEATGRTTRESPFVAPFISNIPFLQRRLPESARLTRPEPFRREFPLLRQFTGITIKTKTSFEREIDRLNLRRLFPKTGDRTLDRLLTQAIGQEFGGLGETLIKTQKYLDSSTDEKKQLIRDVLSAKKKEISSQVKLPFFLELLRKIKTRDKQLDKFEELVKKNKLNKAEANELLKNRSLWISP